ncbi:hypothetical protein FB45DRAFT_1123916 [Roridomyces roridus]|uniref:F-box domain-containing protein n=1 Tax=Roridomyces roridus TaxID=1738132 RepID=A0AAD7F8Y8_9AGAR|nr:hypothetical protein FB45DRAFT_1123916 [Roridomyces roridus]
MRNLHPSRFPTSVLTPVPVCSELPLDICLNIFGFCSPFDLAQLSLASKFLRAFSQRNNHLWNFAFLNICRGQCPPLPPPPIVEASGNYSPEACALWIFGGGLCTSKCKGELLFQGNALWHDKKHQCRNEWLPREAYTLDGPELVYRYSLRAVERAQSERVQATAVSFGSSWRHPERIPVRNTEQLDLECVLRARDRLPIAQNARELRIWQKLYFDEKDIVERANLLFIKSMSMAEREKVQGVLRCPAALGVFKAFNRDLELITTTVWAQIRALTLSQLEYMENGLLLGAPRPTDKHLVSGLGTNAVIGQFLKELYIIDKRTEKKTAGDVFETLLGALVADRGTDVVQLWITSAFQPIILAAVAAFYDIDNMIEVQPEDHGKHSATQLKQAESVRLGKRPSRFNYDVAIQEPSQKRMRASQDAPRTTIPLSQSVPKASISCSPGSSENRVGGARSTSMRMSSSASVENQYPQVQAHPHSPPHPTLLPLSSSNHSLNGSRKRHADGADSQYHERPQKKHHAGDSSADSFNSNTRPLLPPLSKCLIPPSLVLIAQYYRLPLSRTTQSQTRFLITPPDGTVAKSTARRA